MGRCSEGLGPSGPGPSGVSGQDVTQDTEPGEFSGVGFVSRQRIVGASTEVSMMSRTLRSLSILSLALLGACDSSTAEIGRAHV